MERRDNRQAEPTFAAQQQAIDQHKEALHYIQATARTLAPYDVFAPRAIGVGVVVTARGWRLALGCREGRQVEAGLSRESRFGRLLKAARLRAVWAHSRAPTQYSKRITFQHTFPLLRRSQSKPTPADTAAGSAPIILKTTDRRPSGKPPITNPASDFTKSTRATTVKRASAANAKQTPEERREYERARSQTPERKEYRRQLRRKQIRIAKETGKCKDCSNPAIPGQTKC